MKALIQPVGLTIYCVWVLASFAMSWRLRPPLVRFLYHELKPLYWPAAIATYYSTVMSGHLKFWDAFDIACAIFNWFFYRNIDDDDDRWKRRRRKVIERIQAIGGRLTVIPEGAQ